MWEKSFHFKSPSGFTLTEDIQYPQRIQIQSDVLVSIWNIFVHVEVFL